ncbi:DUF4097 family beta strand repeat protein [Natronosporangium hydrolyticum]|uniref:DUF4097 family beta strand repeat protein n=1 Tax=Natronosporangium hydrolyticum TaxID=2811111 RepID=A0A895YMM3_9ACTN|nr:DUF4097 family beta strand repeat-containing protein [Natronosporangium hydrolyticum]QSB16719.1 DUF4097 family beta strand repeat protein [Natronosporangium hydrolyticum]
MPKFETPEPISVTLELGVAQVRVAASPRADTVVEVHPSDEADESDVKAAAQIDVDYTNGVLRVTGPKRHFDFSRKSRSVEVSIELPVDSQLSAHLLQGDLRCAGRLGQCQLKTTGNIWLEQTGPLRVHTGAGHITADRIAGSAEVSTGTGSIQIGEVDGAAAVKNSNGPTTIDAVTGDARVRAANGDIHVERAGAGVDAKTSAGGIRLGEAVRGVVVLATAAGDLEIGVAEGTAAFLAVNTSYGLVRNQLADTAGPDDAAETVEVRGRTACGDITIRRS